MQATASETRSFTTVIDVSVILKDVLLQAEQISLQAMNAKAIVAKAGDATRAVRPIVDYAEELARDIIRLVERIEARSMSMTRRSLETFMDELTASHFRRARTLGAEARFIGSIDTAANDADGRLDEGRRRMAGDIGDLAALLDEIDSILLAANIIVAKFRVEVGASESEYRPSFQALVEKFESAVVAIRDDTLASHRHLRALARS